MKFAGERESCESVGKLPSTFVSAGDVEILIVSHGSGVALGGMNVSRCRFDLPAAGEFAEEAALRGSNAPATKVLAEFFVKTLIV